MTAKRKGWHERRFEARPTAVATSCDQCGRPMWLPATKVDEYRTCGGACAVARKRAPSEARARDCATCGKTFTPRPSQLRLGQGRYCGQMCNTDSQEAMNTPEAHRKAAKGWKLTLSRRDFVPRGPKNGRWNGGKKAAYERRKASGYIRDQNNKRRDARRKSLPKGAIPALEAKQKMRCANCRTCLKNGYHLDHIIPLSKGGRHELGNVQLLCSRCNLRKSNRMPHEWARMNGRLL